MASLDVIAFARALIDIDSTTGREQAAGEWLAGQLTAMGYAVRRQAVADGRFNVFAILGEPEVVLSTHFDCVPPHIPSDSRDGKLYGRGACDAKGTLATQIAAVERLRASGERRVGLLFVVGEERGSDGAAVANANPARSRYLVNGEPTDSKLATATRGILRVKLNASGRAAHSAAPEQGESAIEKLLDALGRLKAIELPSDPMMGTTFYTVGLIGGGNAPNVIPASAWAEVMFRTVGSADDVLNTIRPLEPLVSIEEVLRVPEVRLRTWPGFPTTSFPFTTDVPLLDRWGTPLLFGPGSFLLAHTADEHVDLDELSAAVSSYERLARSCLAQ